MPRAGRRRKKRRTEKDIEISEQEKLKTPRCFVLKRGAVGDRIKDLVQDFRMVMMPNCAKSLRESKNNRIEDFMAVAGHYGVSHLIIFTATKLGTYMKLAKLPQGPTLTFKVESFSLARNIKAMQRRPHSNPREFASAPLQVLNGFGSGSGDARGEGATKSGGAERQLTMEMLRGLFPSIDVQSFNQAECRRVALFHYDKEKDSVHFRHFSVGRRQAGIHRGISRLLNPHKVPKLTGRDDVADYVLGEAGASDSEMEEAPSMNGGGQVKVRLTEVGPRLELLLVKCEEGVQSGAVLFHRYLKRTPSEQEVLEERARQRRKLKERNAKLEAQAADSKKKLREMKKRKAEATKKVDNNEEGEDDASSDNGAGAGSSGNAAPKKKRFHPFARGAKARKVSKDNTVEIDDRPSKMRNRRGGHRQRDGRDGEKGGGKGKRGAGKGGKGGAQKRVLDAFRGAQKRQRQ